MKKHSTVTKLSTVLSRFISTGKGLNVTIIGAFGARNVGDLAIMKTIVNDLGGNDQIEYTFASRDNILKHFYRIDTVNPFSIRGLVKLLRDDAIVVGGGGLYGHETHRYLVMMLPFLWILKTILQKKLIFYNVGIYDAERKSILRMLWPVLRRADEIILRDDSDLQTLPDDIRRRAVVEPDITFLLQPKAPRDELLEQLPHKLERLVGLSLRYVNVKDMGNSHDARVARVVTDVIEKQLLEKGYTVVFIPYQPIDSEYANQYLGDLLSKYPKRFIIIDTAKLAVEEIKWIISKLKLAIGMRLHFQIFASDLDIPLVGISYAPKCKNFLRKRGCADIDAYTISSDGLKRSIDLLNKSFLDNTPLQPRPEHDPK